MRSTVKQYLMVLLLLNAMSVEYEEPRRLLKNRGRPRTFDNYNLLHVPSGDCGRSNTSTAVEDEIQEEDEGVSQQRDRYPF
ncbi:unnamed protein product [Soboliphyme baturini]|uniref:Secreted protein n=1 Tax=Soboliphyme baturini TaxID=241478 RepID=A0A183IJS5_9BILA|nr:unnamed protein product [Soboliphyme baturini]